jgi:hypothetical protein
VLPLGSSPPISQVGASGEAPLLRCLLVLVTVAEVNWLLGAGAEGGPQDCGIGGGLQSGRTDHAPCAPQRPRGSSGDPKGKVKGRRRAWPKEVGAEASGNLHTGNRDSAQLGESPAAQSWSHWGRGTRGGSLAGTATGDGAGALNGLVCV